MGRFIAPDTIVPDPYNPQSLNRYAYCLNNPLIYTDPSGNYWNGTEDVPGPPVPSDYEYTLPEVTVTAQGPSVFAGSTLDMTWPTLTMPAWLSSFGEGVATILGDVAAPVLVLLTLKGDSNPDIEKRYRAEQAEKAKAKENTEKAKDSLETDKSDSLKGGKKGDLPANGKPNSSSVKDYGEGKGQIRDYGPDGKAKTDYDFGHDHGAGDPHAHDWDWTQTPPRQPGRPLQPGE